MSMYSENQETYIFELGKKYLYGTNGTAVDFNMAMLCFSEAGDTNYRKGCYEVYKAYKSGILTCNSDVMLSVADSYFYYEDLSAEDADFALWYVKTLAANPNKIYPLCY